MEINKIDTTANNPMGWEASVGCGEFEFASNVEVNLLKTDDYANRLHQEAQMLANIFPPEIWEQIVSTHLKINPDAVETLANSSAYFRELLLDKRVLFLAKNVLNVVYHWLSNNKQGNSTGPLEKDLLQWRQVCSTWNWAVDELVQEQFLAWIVILPCGIIKRKEHIAKFVPHFAETHQPSPSNSRTPFIGGLLLVDTNFQNESNHYYWNEFLALLGIYGHLVSHLRFDTTDMRIELDLTREQFYLKFRKMLTLLPNLKSLWLEWYNFLIIKNGFVQHYPLPKLANMTALKIGQCPADVFFNLLRENDQLSSLNVNFQDDYELCQQVYHETSHCQLTKLTFEVPPNTNIFSWSEVFNMIASNWADTLEYLKLALPISDFKKCFRDSLKCRLNLPKVKVLELKTDLHAISFDFLLGMPCLETTRISSIPNKKSEYYCHHNTGKDITLMEDSKWARGIVKFIGDEEVIMHQCNIWNLFNNLNILEVDGTLYRRRSTVHENM